MTEEPRQGESLSFEEARARLRARGYLDRGVEGAVLKGALAARSWTRGVLRGAFVAAVLLALALAASETALLSISSALSLRDALVLFLWLLLGGLVTGAALVLLLVGVAWVRTRGRQDPEGASTELGIAFGLLAGAAGAVAAAPALESAGFWAAAGVLVAVAGTVFVAVRVARGLAFTVLLASGRAVLERRSRAGAVAALALALLAVGALALLRPRRPAQAGEPLLVAPNTRRVVVVGVDGWSDRYLPSPRPPRPSLSYTKAQGDPAAFWTTVATGERARRHGVGSLDLVRVWGVATPFRPLGGSEWYLGRVLPAISLARRESVTNAARRVPAIWEVAQRAGIAALTVNWWTTYPAGGEGGTILSNHLFFAARAGSSLAGEGWPADAVARAAKLAPRSAPPAGSVTRLVADAEGLDEFAIRAFLEELERGRPRLSLLYLPGLDILGAALGSPDRETADRVFLASAITRRAERLNQFCSDVLPTLGADLTVLVLDGGRQRPDGSVELFGPLARGAAGRIDPSDLAPTALAVLGVPASRELAGKPRADLVIPGAISTETVASWGRRDRQAPPAVDPREYTENLRSLGYLK